jgi:probable 2-oxoglutarate dehydrogenase E1 component DHKTD1
VALGKARAKQMHLYDMNTDTSCQLGDRVMCVQLHGDAVGEMLLC